MLVTAGALHYETLFILSAGDHSPLTAAINLLAYCEPSAWPAPFKKQSTMSVDRAQCQASLKPC